MMGDPEKAIPPVVVSQWPDSPSSSPQTPSHKEFWSPIETSPTSSRSDSDNDERALTLTSTQVSRQTATRTATRITTRGTDFTLDPNFEVDFEPDDRGDPRNWSMWYKAYAIFTISFGTLGVVMYSTSYTSGMAAMMLEFGITSEPVATLGVTAYLLGLAVGSLLLAPIAETYGRKPVYTICSFGFTLLVIPAALAQNLQSVIITRFVGALFGSAMIANAPGSIADLVSDEYRATAFSIWSIGPMNGPVVGPTIGGFVTQYLGWRWTNWIVMIWAGVAFVLLLILDETYAPVLLQRRAKKLRKENDDERYWSRYDIRVGFWELMRINLKRPFVMALTEPICMFWNVYISICYGTYISLTPAYVKPRVFFSPRMCASS
jgi:multidrug resistance protein